MTVAAGQLPLGIGLRDSATFENYYPAGNELVLQTLQADEERYVYLWGGKGTGKTHLLQAICHAAADADRHSAYIPLNALPELSPEILTGLEQQAVIVLDDIQLIAGHEEWELALFHLYNRAQEAGARLVVSSTVSPAGLALELADLASRLSWGPVFQLESLNDDEKRAALQLRARRRGLIMAEEVADYLLKRGPRDMDSLFTLLNRLDEASLVAQRRLTIPFVRELLN